MKSQKNEIFKLIEASDLTPNNFQWEVVRSEHNLFTLSIPSLKYKNSPYFFSFDFNQGKLSAHICPGRDNMTESYTAASWESLMELFEDWLDYLDQEISEPDLWGELSKYQVIDSVIDEKFNDPFTYSQVAQLSIGINNVRAYIEENSWAVNEQITVVNEKLDYLIDAAKRQGRVDWFHTCVGVLVSVSVSLSLAPEQTQNLWNILKSSMIELINFLPPVTIL